MQLLERSVFGLRSAIWTFEDRTSDATVKLFPMVHVAEPAFFQEVSRRLDECDIILHEGVSGHKANRFTKAYLQLVKNRRLGLVAQHQMELMHVSNRMIHVDIEGDEFDQRWAALPLTLRATFALAAPFAGIYLRYFGTKAMLATYLDMDDLQQRRETLDDDLQTFDDLVLDQRDTILIQAIEDWLRSAPTDQKTMGVLFGGAHMRAVIRYLTQRREFRPTNGEWIDVLTL